MADPVALTPAPIVLKDCDLEFELDNYAAHASSIIFTPTASVQTFQGMSPVGQFTDSSEPTWTLNVTFVQDWGSPKSLSKYLYANAGKSTACKFKPKVGTGLPAFNSTVTLAHGAIGGPGGQYPTSTVSMGCTKPILDSDDSPATPEPEYGV